MRNLLIMHVHPSSPNSSGSFEDNAATKIQANFRGYRVRKQIKQTTGSGAVASAPGSGPVTSANVGLTELSNAASPGGKRLGHDDAEATEAIDDGRADECATKIQAGIRGYLVRKKQKLASEAATKIQANFRGFKTRQLLKQRADGN